MLRKLVLLFLSSMTCFFSGCDFTPDNQEITPIIYSTDLFHPPGDMDDQVDLAALYGLPGINIKLVILDHGQSQLERPGKIPLSQLNKLTGKSVRAEIGLTERLADPKDKALEQAPKFQAAVNALIEVLRETPGQVVIITVGSLRDIAAGYNRVPQLFHEKVARILVFAGEASKRSFIETNVKMDRRAFATVMNSDLPIYWIPCFDGGLWQNQGRGSYWQTTYGKILEGVADPLLQYFIYAAKRSQEDPLQALEKEVDQNLKGKLFKSARNLWSCSLFYIATGKTIIKTEQGYDIVPEMEADPSKLLFDFVPVNIKVSSHGEIQYLGNDEGHRVMQFRVNDYMGYKTVMTTVLNALMVSVGKEPI